MSEVKALVIGLARSGSALARTLHREGFRVTVVDRDDSPALRERTAALPSGVDVRLGGYSVDVARGFDMVSPSPGVPWDAQELELARSLGIPVRSEISLVFERCKGRIAGITGTNGKTTTTTLVAAILERSGRRVHLGGNIGVPMLDRLGEVHEDDWVVLELSSFQIETVDEPRCTVACVLNVTPDHLDRHHDFETYAKVKQRVVRFASDAAILGYDDPATRAMAQAAQCSVRYFGLHLNGNDGATVREGDVVTVEGNDTAPVMPVSAIPLFGAHNVLNVLAATAMTRAAGVDAPDIASAVGAFRAVRHRLQTVAEHAGVLWVNDSKATNAESAVMALRAFAGRSIVWIGGGRGAGTSSDALVDAVTQYARFAVLNGDSAAELDAALAARGYESRAVVPRLRDAVSLARDVARAGDVVLLAPGFKSFDQFRDFEDRGDTFIALVAEMTAPVRGRS